MTPLNLKADDIIGERSKDDSYQTGVVSKHPARTDELNALRRGRSKGQMAVESREHSAPVNDGVPGIGEG